MKVIKQSIKMDDNLKKRLVRICTFASKKVEISDMSIRYIPKTNIAYIEPYKAFIDENTYLIFGNKEFTYIANTTIDKSLSIKELEREIN